MNLLKRAQTALEQKVGVAAHDEAVLQQSPMWMRSITWALMGTTGAAVAWLCLAQTDEIVMAPGKLQPIGTVNEVRIPVNGVVRQVFVKEGTTVQKGQPLLAIDGEATTDKRNNLLKSINLKKQELDLKQQELNRYLQVNSAEQEILSDKLELSTKILQRLESLGKVGGISELQVLTQRNEVQETAGKLKQVKLDRSRQIAQLEQTIRQLNGQLAELRTSLSETEMNLRYQVLKAPVSGVVFDLKARGSGYVARGEEPVLKLVPQEKLEAKVEVPSADIGFVRQGMKADINIDSFPASDFGVLQGSVRQLGSDALPPDAMNQSYRYPVNLALTSQTLKLKNGTTLPLQAGMSLQAHIKLRKVSYLQLLLGGMRDKADSLRRI